MKGWGHLKFCCGMEFRKWPHSRDEWRHFCNGFHPISSDWTQCSGRPVSSECCGDEQGENNDSGWERGEVLEESHSVLKSVAGLLDTKQSKALVLRGCKYVAKYWWQWQLPLGRSLCPSWGSLQHCCCRGESQWSQWKWAVLTWPCWEAYFFLSPKIAKIYQSMKWCWCFLLPLL